MVLTSLFGFLKANFMEIFLGNVGAFSGVHVMYLSIPSLQTVQNVIIYGKSA